jgi:hypothetical protein
MTRNKLVRGILFGGISAVLFKLVSGVLQPGLRASSEINMGPGQVAIHGYDTVAYFTESKAAEGSPNFVHRWKGAEWRFASASHRDMFAGNPEKFAPQYGGY